jgi:hypothetical protein
MHRDLQVQKRHRTGASAFERVVDEPSERLLGRFPAAEEG